MGATVVTSDASAAVVSSGPLNIQFGPANGGPGNVAIPIDFDGDGEIEFELVHGSNSLGEDYLEIEKNIEAGDPSTPFPDLNGDGDNSDLEYLTDLDDSYPVPLMAGTSIGPTPPAGMLYDFVDTLCYDSNSDFVCEGTRKSNRLIDHDSGVDTAPADAPWNPPAGDGNFDGSTDVTQYLGLRWDFDGDATGGNVNNYGWVGVRITDDATASGELVGFAYETTPDTPIAAGAVPEPGTMALAALGGITLAGSWVGRRLTRTK